jgi:hypothetical protein
VGAEGQYAGIGQFDLEPAEAKPAEAKPIHKPGKQRGALGIGRPQVFQAHEERPHHPEGQPRLRRIVPAQINRLNSV